MQICKILSVLYNSLFIFLTMIFNRKDIFSDYPWLMKKKQRFIISADYNGLICASFLTHYLGWILEGYYDFTSMWITSETSIDKEEIIWVDINVLPKKGRAIGGHIISINKEKPQGFQTSCNPNIIAQLDSSNFNLKFPFSTLIFLLWLHDKPINKTLISRLLVLHSDDTWLKYQNFPDNVKRWIGMMPDYNWSWLFQKINSLTFEQRIDQILYPELSKIGALTNRGKLVSNKLKIKSRQLQFNPDWDEDVILNLYSLFGTHLSWTPPRLPQKLIRIDGVREKVDLHNIKSVGLSKFLLNINIFSYAIPSPKKFDYTIFKKI